MRARAVYCSDALKGYSFNHEEHVLIGDWAHRNDHKAVIHLDHGVAGEEYEEAIMLLFGASRRARFILWRSLHAVVVQPVIGRRKEYCSVQQALEGSLLNKPVRQSNLP